VKKVHLDHEIGKEHVTESQVEGPEMKSLEEEMEPAVVSHRRIK
jgi:hypothetical protein